MRSSAGRSRNLNRALLCTGRNGDAWRLLSGSFFGFAAFRIVRKAQTSSAAYLAKNEKLSGAMVFLVVVSVE